MNFISRIILLVAVVVLFAGCAKKLELHLANPDEVVVGVGFSEIADDEAAKQEALKQARQMAAHQLAVDALEFEFTLFEDYPLIKLHYPEGLEAGELAEVKKLDALRTMVKVRANRPDDVLAKMRRMQVVSVKRVCKSGPFNLRLEMAEKLALEEAAKQFAEAKYGTSEGKFKGTITIPRMRVRVLDVGIEVAMDVAFRLTERKELTNADKAAVLFEAWRRAAQRKAAHLPEYVELFNRAVKYNPRADYYAAFGNYFAERNDLKRAKFAFENAVKLAPKNFDYLDKLRRIYLALGQNDKAQEMQKRIDELSAVPGENVKEWTNEAEQEETIVIERENESEKPAEKKEENKEQKK